MRIAVYNQMFGLNGNSFFSTLAGHYFVHFQKDQEKVFARVDLGKNIRLVERSNADMVGICEIYEGQEDEISERLKRLGYKYFYFGKGHRFKYNDKHVIELLASKFKGEQLDFGKWPLENRIGGGGGFVVCKFKEPEVNVFHVHLGVPIRNFFQKQIECIEKVLKELDGKTIIMGDFNYSWRDLQKYFPDFELVTEEVKSCSTTPIMRWFYNKDVDHILVRGFEKEKAGSFEGRSDHKLIYADLK
jgi:endonuclease/exonuclease/phosphatase family metal-dependent hydrolase